MFSPITWVELWSRLRLPAPFAPPATRRRAFTAGHLKRSLSAPCRAWSRPAPAPLPSAEAPSVSDARGSPGLPEGRQGEWLWCHNTSRLPSATPTKPGPAVSNLGPGCRVGSASCAQDPVQCCRCGPCWSRFSGMPGQHARPTGFSVHRQAHARACSGSGVVLARYIALARRGTSLCLGIYSSPRNPPGWSQPNPTEPSETTAQATFLRGHAFGGGRGAGNSFGKGVGIIGVPFASEVWTICVPSLLVLSLLLLITKKEIATGVMNHDRFVAIGVPESRRPIGLRAAPSTNGSRFGSQTLVKAVGRERGLPGVMAPPSASASGNQKS